MKKNILLVHSFIVLPLLTSSFIFSSEKRDKDFPALTQVSLTRSGSQKKKSKKAKRREQQVPQAVEKALETAPAIEEVEIATLETPVILDEQIIAQVLETVTPTIEEIEAVTLAAPVVLNEQIAEDLAIENIVIELPMPESKETTTQKAPQALEQAIETPIPAAEQFDAIIAAAPTIIDEQVVAQEFVTENIVIDSPMSESKETTTQKKPSCIPTEKIIRERMAKAFASIQEIATKATTETTETTLPSIDPLAASIYEPIPVIKQGLGWGEWAKSKLSTTWFAIDALKSKTFDPENADHMGSLNSAAEKLVLNGDSAGLQDLLQACRTNYSHIKLDKSVALQIQRRFQLDEQGIKKEYADQIERESLNLRKTQERIFAQNALLIQNVAAQLESSNMELAKAQVAYMTATNDIIAKQNKKLEATHQGTQHLGKLYRKLDTKKSFDSEYLNNLKKVNTLQENTYSNMETLDRINETLTGTLSLLTPKKSDILQLTDK